MTPYIFLIVFIFVVSFLFGTNNNGRKDKRDIWFLLLTFIYIYLFVSLRDFSVGRDIPGYIEIYEQSADVPWDDWSWTIMEPGYQFLMKVSSLLGLSSRVFFFFIYALIIIPIWLLISYYSKSPLLSLILFVCFQFFAFTMSAVRQSIAMSLCLVSLFFAVRHGWKNFVLYLFVVLIASTIHRTALIFIPAYFIIRIKPSSLSMGCYAIAAVLCYSISRTSITYLFDLFGKEGSFSTAADQHLGLSLFLIIGFALMSYFSPDNSRPRLQKEDRIIDRNVFFNLLATAVCLLFLFNGSLLLRASMYYYFIAIVAVPSFVGSLPKLYRNAFSLVLIALLLWHFFFSGSELEPFDLVPYKLFF